MISICPYCEKQFDRHLCTGGDVDITPDEGDMAMCIACGSIGVFTKESGIRKPNAEEVREIAESKDIQRMIRIWKATEAIRPPHLRRH